MQNQDSPSGDFRDSSKPVRFELTSYQQKWIDKQLTLLLTKRIDVIRNAVEEFVARHGPGSFPGMSEQEIICLAVDEFIERHRLEFLPVES
jgi:hypothetical protein